MTTERDVYNALTGAGFSMAQAAGIMGNAQNESGFNPEAVGDGGTSFGLVQWHEPSYPFAPSLVTGNVAVDLRNQIQRIVQASHGVNMSGSAAQVAGNWASQFERCVGCQPGGAQFIGRQQNADRIFAQAQAGHWPSGPGSPGGGGAPGGGTPVSGTSSPGLWQDVMNVWNLPITIWHTATAPVTGIVTATEDVAQAIAGVSNAFEQVFDWISWWFVPSHIVRVIAFLLGAPLVGFGIFNLTRTGQPYSVQAPLVGSIPMSGGNLAPAVGIAEVTLGAVLLFIAFHNLPSNVVDLPSLITYVKQNVAPEEAEGGGGTL